MGRFQYQLQALTYMSTLTALYHISMTGATICPTSADIEDVLGKRLSPGSSISNSSLAAPRWDLYSAPAPAYVVEIASERDVATTVEYCNKYGLTFLAQSQGNGWAVTLNLGDCGVVIDISRLNAISFNSDKTEARIQGGTVVQDMVKAAYANDTRFANPTCTCLGFLGDSLGGGITREMGLYGTGVDQIISVNVVLASGQVVEADTTHNPDLIFAMRGAAPNFGIVTSAVVKAYPTPKVSNTAWEGALTFADDQLESLIQTIHDLDLEPDMEVDLLFSTSGPPANTPMITAIPIFFGNASAGEEAFKPLLKLGPASNGAVETPYDQWGAFAASFCMKGPRKPTYGVSISREGLAPATWTGLYNEFKSFIADYPAAGSTTILAEYYPVQKAVQLASDTSSYPFRKVPIHIVAVPSYTDANLDGPANAFGARVRDLFRKGDELKQNSTYINFAHGDEPLQTVYGESLERLQELKKTFDPQNRFNQWFPLTPTASNQK